MDQLTQLRTALRFYARGEHTAGLDAWEEEEGWLFPDSHEDAPMVEAGGIARAALQGKLDRVCSDDLPDPDADWHKPIDGEVGVPAPADNGSDFNLPGGSMSTMLATSILRQITDEVGRAVAKFPTWPTDPIHAVAVLGEEFGELQKAVLQLTYEPHKTSADEVRTEAIQTAAMALRFLLSLHAYEYRQSAQHSQGDALPTTPKEPS